MDAEILARIQFALTIGFHYLFPPLSIGLGVLLVVMEGLYLKTRNPVYESMTRFWVKVFGLIFGIGVATGIVMEFQFGTNWSVYSVYVGDIFGSALAAEGLFAFALESGFLGLLLFGWNKVSPKVHFIATAGVAAGSIFSAIWIIVANSWQQTPAGFIITGEGESMKAVITDFWAVVFNPSSMQRLSHVLIAAMLTGAFLVLSINAFFILKERHSSIAKPAFKIALSFALAAGLMQLVSGHSSARGVAEHQPAKLAALEGIYRDGSPGDLYLAGWVDQEKEETWGIKIPGLLSFLVYNDFDRPVTGLDHFPADERPSAVNAVFQSYHLMVAIGMFFILLTLFSAYLWMKGKLFRYPWLMHIFVWSVILPQLANQAGWFSAEVGRQPWVVYGLMKTSAGISPGVTAGQILFSIILFSLVYLLLLVLFLYLLDKKIRKGYEEPSAGKDSGTNDDIETTATTGPSWQHS